MKLNPESQEASAARVPIDAARHLIQGVLGRLGVPQDDARVVAEALVAADQRGIHSHGLSLLPNNVRRLRAGHARARPDMSWVVDTPATAVLDADRALGPIAAVKAAHAAVEKARATGIGAVAVREANHVGAAGYYAERIAEAGLVGLMTSNGGASMAAPGAAEPIVGNVPVAMAFPVPNEGPMVIDLALSVATVNKIRQYERRGERLPAGWAANREGLPTDDPAEALAGLLIPIGEHKGFALATMFEVLAAGLSGGLFGWEILAHEHSGMSLFVLALDPARFVGAEAFQARTGELARKIRTARRQPGVERIYTPGERSAGRRAEIQAAGIPTSLLPTEALAQLARELDVEADFWHGLAVAG